MSYEVIYHGGTVIRKHDKHKKPYHCGGRKFKTLNEAKKAIDKYNRELEGHYWPYPEKL